MTQKPEIPPAFPQEYDWNEENLHMRGATLRDYFAAAALQGMLANPKIIKSEADADRDKEYALTDDKDWLVVEALEWADAMLIARG
jgi:hypothetical protein